MPDHGKTVRRGAAHLKARQNMMGLLGMQSGARPEPRRHSGRLPVRRRAKSQGLLSRLLRQQEKISRQIKDVRSDMKQLRALLRKQSADTEMLRADLSAIPAAVQEALRPQVMDTWVQSYRILQQVLNSQVAQQALVLQYNQGREQGDRRPGFQASGFRVYSQSDEDGLLLYIFALIGTTSRVCVEMAFGSPYGANTTNLICNWGWRGLLFEGNKDLVDQSRKFFADHRDTWYYPPSITEAWITAENVNELLRVGATTGEIDLFSLDVDGMEYWIWQALDAVQPRVVVVEYQNIWAADKCVTVPYRPDFVHNATTFAYSGASLAAHAKLAARKGYRLVGCNRYCFNAFFVRAGVGEDVLPAVSVASCLEHPENSEDLDKRRDEAAAGPWVDV